MNVRRVVNLIIAVCVALGGCSHASQAKDDISLHKSCMQCGMDRGTYDFSRMWIDYQDGSNVAICSLHCAAVDLTENIDKTPKSIRAADFNSRHLIDAEKAIWVVGGRKRGVMSKQGKWAFENKRDAENFMKANLGTMVSFEEALEMAFDELPFDTKAIREKRR
jgi:nitrous oxide reductase accessory protein NosL